MRVELVIAKGKHQGKSVRVKKSPFIMGRHEDCNLVVSSSRVSARHATILLRDDGPWIRDLGSTNGTFVNEERVLADRAIRHGDHVRMGPLVVEVLIHADSGSRRKPRKKPSDSDAADILLSASSKFGDNSLQALLGLEDSKQESTKIRRKGPRTSGDAAE